MNKGNCICNKCFKLSPTDAPSVEKQKTVPLGIGNFNHTKNLSMVPIGSALDVEYFQYRCRSCFVLVNINIIQANWSIFLFWCSNIWLCTFIIIFHHLWHLHQYYSIYKFGTIHYLQSILQHYHSVRTHLQEQPRFSRKLHNTDKIS